MKRISVFTGTRAEYGLMKTLIKKLEKDIDIEFNLLISGSHLKSKYGNTINEIKSDGIKNISLFPIANESKYSNQTSFQTAETIKLISQALETLNPNYLIVLGDRYESFAAATAAHLSNIKVVHIHGGEVSLGSLDNKLRNAISQLSTIHFTSADIHKRNVQNIIGSSENVYNVGPLVVDGLLDFKKCSKNEFEKDTKFSFSKINFLVTFHPETLSSDFGIIGFKNLLNILDNYDCNILFTAPNADEGSDLIIEIINIYIQKNRQKYFYIPSLGQKLFLNALVLFDCIIGNSSSGLIEAPLLKKQVLNIGNRQKGRYRFGPVIDVTNDFNEISKAVVSILNIDKIYKYESFNYLEEYKAKSPSTTIIKILKDSL